MEHMGKLLPGEDESADQTPKLPPRPWTETSTVFDGDLEQRQVQKARPTLTEPREKTRLKEKFALTRILLMAATISTRLLGRATSRLPMYWSQETWQVQRVKLTGLAFAFPFFAHTVLDQT